MTKTLGRWISIAGHPFILVPLAIAIATSRDRASRGPVLGLVGISMAILAAFIARSLRRGEVTDVDVSTREHRPGMYRVAIATAVASVAILRFTHQSREAVHGALVSAVLLLVGAFVNARIKASLHTAFALMAAGIAFKASAIAGAVFLVVALAVAWARVAYGRHTRPEVLVGGVLGILAALAQAFG